MWTNRIGNLIGFLSEVKTAKARSNCVLGSASSIFAQETKQKKAILAISPLNSILLEPKTSAGAEKEKIIIEVTTNATSQASPTTKYCSSGLSKISCEVEKSSSFTFTL